MLEDLFSRKYSREEAHTSLLERCHDVVLAA